MSKPLLTLLTSSLLLAAFAAANATDMARAPAAPVARTVSYDAPVSCDVRVSRTAHGVAIEASAFSGRSFDGDYSLSIIKSGANSSDISQDGPVYLRAGERTPLAGNEISIGHGERVRAELSIADERGVVCRDSVRL